MKQADFDLLLELYLDRDLTPAQHRELLDAVQSDPERKREFLAAVEQSLRLASGLKPADAALYERVAYLLEKEKESGEETVNGVLAKLKREPLPSPRTRRFPAWKVLVPLAACLAIVAGAFAYRSYQARRFAERVVARIDRTDAGVSIRRDGDLLPASEGMLLARGDEIETAGEHAISFTYTGEDTRVRVEEGTAVVLKPSSRGKTLLLRKGRIDANVAPQPAGAPMSIITPQAELAVLGTAFSVTASRDTTGLNVTEGTVRIALPDRKTHEDVKEGGVAFAKTGVDRVIVPGKLVVSLPIHGLPKGSAVTGIAVAGKDAWVHVNRGEGLPTVLARVSPASGEAEETIEPEEGFRPGSCITWKNGLLWGFARDGKSLKGVRADTGATRQTIPLPAGEISSLRVFDIHGDVAWMRGRTRDELVKVALDDGRILARVRCPFAIDRIAASGSAVYVGESGWNACRIDPEDGSIVYRFMCEAGSVTGDMALDDRAFLWTVEGTAMNIHVLEAE